MKLLESIAPEQGTYAIKFTFKDEFGNLVTPATLYWWLTDLSGTVINDRSEVEITPITNPHYLVLTDADLSMITHTDDFDYRVITLKGTYNSDLGSGLPLVYAVMFKLDNLLVIAQPLNIEVYERVIAWEDMEASV